MKLRARKKSFPSKIKQEDRNPSLINDQLSTTEVASTSTFGLTVKQEDSKDHKVLLKQQSMAIDMLIDMHSNVNYYIQASLVQKIITTAAIFATRDS
jgi:hypothetical protein